MKNMENNEKLIRFNLRLPEDLYEKIGKKAAQNFRSINNEMIIAIMEYVREPSSPIFSDKEMARAFDLYIDSLVQAEKDKKSKNHKEK